MESANQLHLLATVPTLLEQVISSQVGIFEASEAIEQAADLNSLATFWDVLFSSPADEDQVSFQFEGHDYILENSQNENGRILQIKNKVGQVLAKFENGSLEQLRNRIVLLSMFIKLEPNARATFQPLFDIPKIGHVDAKSPIVSGDLDGSMARLIVLGIQAGIIHIDADGVEILAWLINVEAAFLEQLNNRGDGSCLRDFQSDKKIQNAMEELAKHLTYKKGDTKLILIGDVLYDRFACDIATSLRICVFMSRQGAQFITGNHDNLILSEWGNPEDDEFDMPAALAFGAFAKNDIEESDCLKYQQEIFSNAYYDKEANKLYLHHGLEEKDGKIYTAFGEDSYPLPLDGETFDVEKFVQWINRQPRPSPSVLITDPTLFDENSHLDYRLTGFRPDDEAMKRLARKLGMEIVHGHNGNVDTFSADVLVLNARKRNQFAVVAARVGRSEPTVQRENAGAKKRSLSKFMYGEQFINPTKRQRTDPGTANKNIVPD